MSGDNICVSVVSPDGNKTNVRCSYVSLPCQSGSIGILYNHAPLLCALSNGVVMCRKSSGEQESISVPGGIAQVLNNVVTVLVS